MRIFLCKSIVPQCQKPFPKCPIYEQATLPFDEHKTWASTVGIVCETLNLKEFLLLIFFYTELAATTANNNSPNQRQGQPGGWRGSVKVCNKQPQQVLAQQWSFLIECNLGLRDQDQYV